MVIVHDAEYYQSRKPEPDLGTFRNFLRFVWNPNKKLLFGRSGREWVSLWLFYFWFFLVLGSVFTLQMWITIKYVSKLERPFYLQHGSSSSSSSYFGVKFPVFSQLDNSPGIAFKPNILLPTKSPIIWIDNSSANARPKRYVQALSDFLQEYNKSEENYKTVAECNDELSNVSSIKPCFFNIESLGVCGQSPYGYTYPLQPCVLIKFNKRFNWVPIPYNKSSLLPENMPHALQKAVRFSNKFQIWLWCDGVNNVDKEHIGEIEYLPNPGFPVQYFPFVGQPDYLAPMVALRFKNITLFRLVKVKCSLWAHNINKDAQNTLNFQIILGKPPGNVGDDEYLYSSNIY